MSAPAKLPECARYSFGADEFIFVEIDETMSLEAFFIAKSSPMRSNRNTLMALLTSA